MHFSKLVTTRRSTLALFLLALVYHANAAQSQQAHLFLSDYSWKLNIENGSEESLTTNAANVALADEVLSEVTNNQELCTDREATPCRLTFRASVTGMSYDFRLRPLEAGAGLVFDDGLARDFDQAISIGNIDEFENDDFSIEILSDSLYAIAFTLINFAGHPEETLSVRDTTGSEILRIDASGMNNAEQFIGIISERPIGEVSFDERDDIDDIGITTFKFGTPTNDLKRILPVLDETTWKIKVLEHEILKTTAANILKAEEIESEPGDDEQLCAGLPVCELTFHPQDPEDESLSYSFILRPEQEGAGLTFNDDLLDNFKDAISIGDIDSFQNDDFTIEILSTDLYALGFSLVDQVGTFGEKMRFYSTNDQLLLEIDGSLLTEEEQFIGILSPTPIGRVEYDEGAGIDDIGLRNFQFGIPKDIEGELVDISVHLHDSPDPTGTESQITYIATVRNKGPSLATQLSLQLTIPDESEFVDFDGGDWECVFFPATKQLLCELDELRDESTVTFVLQSPSEAQVLLTKALVKTSQIDLNLTDNSTAETTSISRISDLANSLQKNRYGHSATLLLSGDVLITGGCAGDQALEESELFETATGRLRSTAPLRVARCHHTTTLLPSGHVLVFGGSNGSDTIAAPEIYDPTSDTWHDLATDDPTSASARSHHTATLLASGEVLILGGINETATPDTLVFVPSPEVFIQAAWRPLGNLASSRSRHAATLLPNGKVLVTGGESSSGSIVEDALLFDPETETLSSAGVVQPRARHSATLLPNGKVLVAGGIDSARDPLERTQLYDPEENEWIELPPLNFPRFDHTATLLPSGEVLVAGGTAGGAPKVFETERFDPTEDTWRLTSRLESARSQHTATLLPTGQILIVSGLGERGALSRVELLSPLPGRMDLFLESLMKDRRAKHTATLLPSGKVLTTGGINEEKKIVDTTEVFNSIHSIESGPSMIQARECHSATLLPNGQVLIVGGFNSEEGALATVESFDESLVGAGWRARPPLKVARSCHTATLLPNGEVLVVGGRGSNDEITSSVERYDPSNNRWRSAADLLTSRADHSATLLASGEVLVSGGENTAGSTDRVEIYDPIRDVWREAAPLNAPRARHAAQLLPSGKVLVVGGREGAGSELYDPTSGENGVWHPTAEQPYVRSAAPTLTRLLNGQILLVGFNSNSTEQLNGQLYDPRTDRWNPAPEVGRFREHTATLLPDGSVLFAGGYFTTFEPTKPRRAILIYYPRIRLDRRPVITDFTLDFDYLSESELVVSGTGFRADSEGSGGATSQSAINYPIVELQPLEGSIAGSGVLGAAPAHPIGQPADFWSGELELDIDDLPPVFNQGWHRLTVFAAGVPSVSKLIRFNCSLEVSEILSAAASGPHEAMRLAERDSVEVDPGGSLIFSVEARGARSFQWQRNFGTQDTPRWIDISEANSATYTTPPIASTDSGVQFRVEVSSGCESKTSTPLSVTVRDDEPPQVDVISPDGGEYWTLGSSQVVSFAAFDATTWLCRLEVSLLFSNDGGASFERAPEGGGLPRLFDSDTGCLVSEALMATPISYDLPQEPPSGMAGSLYLVEVTAIDHKGNQTTARSDRPFFIVPPDDESVKTLIFTHLDRLHFDQALTSDELRDKIQELANHPLVAGRVIDLGASSHLVTLYEAWDTADVLAAADPEDHESRARANQAANKVLFAPDGIQSRLLELLDTFTAVEHLILVGDDRVIPMARMPDRTALSPENHYPTTGEDLTPSGTRVARAALEDLYLSDDPLVSVADPIDDFVDLRQRGLLLLPDLNVGRLVESPREIFEAILNFQRHEGVLDVAQRSSKVLVTGYDFLKNSARSIDRDWRRALGCGQNCDAIHNLIGNDFTEGELRMALCGDGSSPAILSLNGHATHYQEGVPGTSHFDIRGLDTSQIADEDACAPNTRLDLDGALIYAVGCHSGLSVDDRASDDDHPLDLPQTFLRRGALAYLANTGYGWGLRHGSGYSEKLMEIFTEDLLVEDAARIGDIVRLAKRRYLQETGAPDVYDIKTLQQWTLFGFPMYQVQNASATHQATRRGVLAMASESGGSSRIGLIEVQRESVGDRESLPPHLTALSHSFDLSAEGIYSKRDADGQDITSDTLGCPDENGCYYLLNEVIDRGPVIRTSRSSLS